MRCQCPRPNGPPNVLYDSYVSYELYNSYKMLDRASRRGRDSGGRHPTPADAHFLLCGNPGMIDRMVALLASEGFTEHSRKNPDGQVHLERYW